VRAHVRENPEKPLLGIGVVLFPIIGYVLFYEYNTYSDRYKNTIPKITLTRNDQPFDIDDFAQWALTGYAIVLIILFGIGLCGSDVKYYIILFWRYFRRVCCSVMYQGIVHNCRYFVKNYDNYETCKIILFRQIFLIFQC